MSTAGASRANLWGAASERGSRKLQITKARRPCTTVTHLRNDEALRIVGEEECDPSAARSPVRHSSARAMEELVHCVRRMVQRELGLNGFCGGGPDEGLGVPVGGGNVAGDRAFEVVDRAKDAPFEALPSELGEEAFHGIEPGAGGRREVERPSRRFRCELSRWRDSRYMDPGWIGRGGANGSGRRLQGAAIHRRGDPVGRSLVSDVSHQLPRSRTDAPRSRRRGRPHNDSVGSRPMPRNLRSGCARICG